MQTGPIARADSCHIRHHRRREVPGLDSAAGVPIFVIKESLLMKPHVRPAGITVLAGLQCLGAACSLIGMLAVLTFGPKPLMIALAGGMAALLTCCAHGLWTMRPHGRAIQLILAWVGLAAFPAGTMVSIPVLNYLSRPSIRRLFGG